MTAECSFVSSNCHWQPDVVAIRNRKPAAHPVLHAGAEFILHFLRIDSESTFALTNQSSSIHFWLTVDFNDGSSNYGEIELHMHRGSKGSCGPTPRGLKYDHPVFQQTSCRPGGMGRFMLREQRSVVTSMHLSRVGNITAAARVCSELLLPISMQLCPPRHTFPAVSSTVCLPASK